ncbi:MAG: GNAT family N-acetyltransferase [Anaerolineae bacterium]|nr:GNAT family N-acetyltransferase [Anaerolineae bacterium]
MLVGKNVIVRTVRHADLDRLYDLMADVRAMGDYWPPNIESEIQRSQELAEHGAWEQDRALLLITDREQRIVGQIAFFKSASYHNAYEIAYRLYHRADWGKGYMTEAVHLLVAFLFDTRPVDRIQATTLPGNAASQQVLKNSGFQFEGVMRRALFHRGRADDLHLFSIVRGEHRPLAELLDGA